MKRLFFFSLTLFISMALFPLSLRGADKKIVDFNFPKDVSKNALTDLNTALKSGNGEMVVDAMVRYSLAQSGISQDNMADIVDRLEATIAKEPQPHVKALLRYFEAMVFSQYGARYTRWDRENPADSVLPKDYSEWDRRQFESKVDALLKQSLSDRDALHAVRVTDMPGIIQCNDLGAQLVPTLHEFLSMKALEMLTDEALRTDVEREWVARADDGAARIFASMSCNSKSRDELYDEFSQSPHAGIILSEMSAYKSNYERFKQYVGRFPNAPYTPAIKNKIAEIEEKRVSLTYPENISSRDSVKVRITTENVNRITVNVYRLPEELAANEERNRFNIDQLILHSSHEVTVQGTVPFEQYDVVCMLPPLEHGIYVLAPAFESPDGTKQPASSSYYQQLRVSDIALFIVSHSDKDDRVLAVDVKTGKPVKGVSITDGTLTKTTNAYGLITLPENLMRSKFRAILGTDHYGQPLSYNLHTNYSSSSTYANIYTDLNIYRPGEEVKWAAVVYRFNNMSVYKQKGDNPAIRRVMAGEKVRLIFSDTNSEPIDTVEVTTDEFGRVEGTFTIPTDRMNGAFNIRLYNGRNLRNHLCNESVNVSEYKTPTFTVTFPDAPRSFVKGKDVEITGLAETYSGVPVAGADVKLQLRQQQWSWWWWRYRNDNGTVLTDTVARTDASGKFTISLPASMFSENNNRYAHYTYLLSGECTNAAGETQSGNTSFIIGKRRGLSLPDDYTFVNNKPLKLPLTFNSTDDNETAVQCIYSVTHLHTREVVLTGNFRSDNPVIDLTKIPSGEYRVEVSILDDKDDTGTKDDMALILYRPADTTSPIKDSPLWVPEEGRSVDKDNVARITIGTSTPLAHIYYVAASTSTTLAEGWLDYKPGIHTLSIPIPLEPEEFLNVRLLSVYNGRFYQEDFTMSAPANRRDLHVQVTAFRDKLVPGQREKWTFRLVDNDSTGRQGAMMLAMFDKALNKLSANNWSFSVPRLSGNPMSLHTMSLNGSNNNSTSWRSPSFNTADVMLPTLYTYDQVMFSPYMSYGSTRKMLRSSSSDMLGAAAGAMVEDEARMVYATNAIRKEAVIQEEAVVMADDSGAEGNLDNIAVRESDVKTALWMPNLVSDENGNLSVEFEAPNFNTTWIVQALAWDRLVRTDVVQREVLTQKPIMVRANMPRFVRNGDVVTLAASVMNATDASTGYDASIELFNPRTGQVLATRKLSGSLAPKGTEAVSIDWNVPADLPWVGFRIKAANKEFGDGEQVMVPVLPATQPVIETQPFYIDAGMPHFEAPLPHFPADARVTLEYCDNPTWYCVTALPTIFDDNLEITTSLVHSLFALDVAGGVAKSNPRIRQAIDHWLANSQDSTLVSMLARNKDLKIGTLLASPWLREADRQTLRMSRLGELFDPVVTAKQRNAIVEKLQSLQMADGGWTWFRYPGCVSSLYTTSTVLELLGEIRQMGYAPDDSRITEMVQRALPYFDAEYLRIYKERENKKDYSGFSSYVYVRTLWSDVPMKSDSKKLFTRALKHMNKNWNKGLSLGEKAFYAMTLNRNGYQKTARNIVESVRQFSITKPNLGMYWDNLQVGWRYFDKVAITSTILQAMNECDPRQDEIDAVRKWILLMKQSNDWGSRSLAADAVRAILTTGSQWLGPKAQPVISVAGEQVVLDELDGYLGYFRKTIPASAMGSVVIDRDDNSPAWGAVYTQYTGQMSQLEAAAIDELSIEKQYQVYGADGKLLPADDLRVGDKVQVRLVIKNAKDLDFVTVADERGACFEPVDQLSGYRHADWSWYYLETKDSRTNLFFSDLQKGTHVITYDVYVMAPGKFSAGIATAQCQYAPQITAHSAGTTITVKAK